MRDYSYKKYGSCPKCDSINIKKFRLPYAGLNDTNYIDCKCNSCKYEWGEKD